MGTQIAPSMSIIGITKTPLVIVRKLRTMQLMANRIKEMREERHVTLEELADRLGTSKGQVAALQAERRQLTLPWLKRLANALNCKVSDLLPDEDVAPRLSPSEEMALQIFRQIESRDRSRALRVLAVLADDLSENAALRLVAASRRKVEPASAGQ